LNSKSLGSLDDLRGIPTSLRWLDPPPYNTKFRSPGCRTGDLYVYKGARKAMETGLRSAIGPQEV
jgi:hypothetical protein